MRVRTASPRGARRRRRPPGLPGPSPTVRRVDEPTGPLPAPSVMPAARSPRVTWLFDGEVCLGLDRAALDDGERLVLCRRRVDGSDTGELVITSDVLGRAE